MSRRHTRRVIRGRAFKQTLPNVDPNRPGSPDYARRHRQFSCDLPQGMKRVDIGAPIEAPGRTVQQVSEGEPQEPEGPVSAPSEPLPATPAPEPVERDWRKEYGLGSDV